MNKSPDALRLANAMDLAKDIDYYNHVQRDIKDAAAELRRLHAQVEALSAAQAGVPAGKVIAWRLIHQSSLGHGDVKGSWIDGAPTEWQIADFSQNAPMARIEYAHAAPQPSPSPAPAQPIQDLQSVNDAVTIELLNERVAYLEAQLAKATAPAQPGQEGEAIALTEPRGCELFSFGEWVNYPLARYEEAKASDLQVRLLYALSDRAARAAPQPATADAVDAERWRLVENAPSAVTLRLHSLRPDQRAQYIDAALAAKGDSNGLT